ncbi:MAG: agmatine deiminase family protein [Phycisphaerales bacterium]|nr:agmatine deiminase family protein [Phycisphaerales bacterium]
MRNLRSLGGLVLVAGLAATWTGTAAGQPAAAGPALVGGRLVYPEGADVPRGLTDLERAWIREHPITAPGTRAAPPTGPVFCPGEYHPAAAIMVAWEGTTAQNNILREMIRNAVDPAKGNARAFVVVDSASEQSTVASSLSSGGIDTSKIDYLIRTTDTIWIRDYGPRYIYEGNIRATIDHTYNRPRPNDDALTSWYAAQRKIPNYVIPLIHGGGNYHISSAGDSYATRLIANENPSLTEPQIIALWNSYQNVDTTLTNPFPTTIDSTQHIDMWMQVVGDRAVVISDWPANPGTTQDVVCDQTAALMQSMGYTVTRIPARSVSGVHYTYTNVMMCNGVVCIPTYTNATMVPYNPQALSAWQTALAGTGKQVVQVNSDALVTSAGVMHCVMMHIPAPAGGANPSALIRSPRGGETFDAGDTVSITWSTDDDQAAVANIDLLLSTDGGATYPTVIASMTADDGSHLWTVPNIPTTHARVRIVARDGDGLTGFDSSPADFTIVGTCPIDYTGDGQVDFSDYLEFLNRYDTQDPSADLNQDGLVDFSDYLEFLTLYDGGC